MDQTNKTKTYELPLKSQMEPRNKKRLSMFLSKKQYRRFKRLYNESKHENYDAFIKEKVLMTIQGKPRTTISSSVKKVSPEQQTKQYVKDKEKEKLAFYMRLNSFYQDLHSIASSYSELIVQRESLIQQNTEMLGTLQVYTKDLAKISKEVVVLIQDFKSHYPIKDSNYDN